MKKKLALILTMVLALVCVFAVSVFADSVHANVNKTETVTLADGQVLNLFDEEGNALIWYISATTEETLEDGSTVTTNTYSSLRADSGAGDAGYTGGTVEYYVKNWADYVHGVMAHQVDNLTIKDASGNDIKSKVVVFNIMDDDVVVTKSDRSNVKVGDPVNCFAGVFSGNSSLQYAYLRLDTVAIQGNTFYNCANLVYINLEDLTQCTRYNQYAFRDCKKLFAGKTLDLSGTGLIDFNSDGVFAGVPFTGLILPNTFKSLGNNWCLQSTGLTSIHIPDGVTSIPQNTFKLCYSLTTVTGGADVTAIGDNAFYQCTALTSFSIPSGVTSIGSSAFYDCKAITSLTVPSGVTAIKNSTFQGCSKLETIVLPAGIKTVETNAFRQAYVKSLTFTSALESVGKEAFRENSNLQKIVGLEYADNTTLDTYMFYGCSGLESVKLPSGLTSIGKGTFQGCAELVEIEIPAEVTVIDTDAFNGCKALKAMYKAGTTPVEYGLIVPEGVVTMGNNALRSCVTAKYIKLPSTLTSLGTESLRDNTALEYVDFSGCTLTTAIGNYMFYNDKALKAVSLPESYTNLDYSQIFSSCNVLEAVYISRSTTKLRAFNGCKQLYFVETPFTLEWSDGMFDTEDWNGQKPEKPEIYYFPSTLVYIEQLLNNCTAVNDVLVFPVGITEVKHQHAFYSMGEKKIVFLGAVTYFKQTQSGKGPEFYFIDKNVNETTVNFDGSTSSFTLYFHGSGNSGKLSTASAEDNWTATNIHLYALDLAPTCTEIGYDNYKCFCGAENEEKTAVDPLGHVQGDVVKIDYTNGYLTTGYIYHKCERDGCAEAGGYTVADDQTYWAAAIFKNNGYSYSDTAILQGFVVDHDALSEYERVNQRSIMYGLAVGSALKLGATNTLFDGTALKDGAFSVSFDDKRQYTIFEMQVTGLTSAYHDTELFVCAYVIDNGVVTYISNGENTSTVDPVTYSQIVAVEEGKSTEIIIPKKEEAVA